MQRVYVPKPFYKMAIFQIYGAVILSVVIILLIQFYSLVAFGRSFFYLRASDSEIATTFTGKDCSSYVFLPQQQKLELTNLTGDQRTNQYEYYDQASACYIQHMRDCSPAYLRIITEDKNKVQVVSVEKLLGKCSAKITTLSGWNDGGYKKTYCFQVDKTIPGLKLSTCTDFTSHLYP